MDESKPDRSSVGSPSHHKETHGRGEDIDADTPIGDFKGPNIFHRAKEEIEAIVDTYQSKRESDKDAATPKKQDNKGSPRHRKETHGRGEGIDADTPISEFKGPNVFHRAKEEFVAIVETVQSKKESERAAAPPKKIADSKGSPRHRKETHGRGEDIDADTPINEFKGPNVFYRAKEEFAAIVETVQSKRESERAAATLKKQSLPAADYRGNPSHRKETRGKGDDIDPDTPINEFKGPNIFHRAKEEIQAIADTIQSKKESDKDVETPKKDGLRASISKKLQKSRNRD